MSRDELIVLLMLVFCFLLQLEDNFLKDDINDLDRRVRRLEQITGVKRAL
jgi:hypothetical protein